MIFDPIVIVKGSNSYNMPLIVTTEPGAVVTAVQGDIEVMSTANLDGKATMYLPVAGTYEVYAVLDGKRSSSKFVEAPGAIPAAFSFASRLPEGYTEIEYIDNASDVSASKSLISMNIPKNPRFDLDMELLEYANNNGYGTGLFGSYIKSNSMYYACGLYFASNGFNGMVRFNTSYNTGGNFLIDGSNAPRRLHVDWDYVNGTITVDDEVKISGRTWTTISGTTTFANCYIFNAPGTTGNTANGLVRLYSFKVYSDGNPYYDLVPARRDSDGKIGLFDLVNNRLVVASNIQPIAGPEV